MAVRFFLFSETAQRLASELKEFLGPRVSTFERTFKIDLDKVAEGPTSNNPWYSVGANGNPLEAYPKTEEKPPPLGYGID